MQRSQDTVQWFVGTAVVLAVPAVIAVLAMDKFALHSAMNAHHDGVLDLFFRVVTHAADGLVPTVITLILLMVKDYRSSLMMGLSCGLSAIVVQLLKHQVFAHVDRPGMHRDQLGGMEWVEGIDLNHHFSFPSGHATAAFAMCMALAIIIGGKRSGSVLAITAGLLAFSRVYLSQHFMEDILAGGALGTVTAWSLHRWLYRSSFSSKAWLGRRLFDRGGRGDPDKEELSPKAP
jgi:membrane-associated phospholipid phosphatase